MDLENRLVVAKGEEVGVFLGKCSSVFLLLMAAPEAYGSSEARGRIGAAAAGLFHSHSNTRPGLHLQPFPQPVTGPDP